MNNNMISTKDLEYIKDMLSWNLIASKKANHYLNHVQDEEVVKAFKDVSEMHSKHYELILNLLQGGKNE